ncbi:hypothetical protein STEG23_011884, partial [Scotinomys teguina]
VNLLRCKDCLSEMLNFSSCLCQSSMEKSAHGTSIMMHGFYSLLQLRPLEFGPYQY